MFLADGSLKSTAKIRGHYLKTVGHSVCVMADKEMAPDTTVYCSLDVDRALSLLKTLRGGVGE